CFTLIDCTQGVVMAETNETVSLPEPALSGDSSLEKLLSQRRSVREYLDTALSSSEVGQLLWAAQGVTHSQGYRTAPSAGALYPLELYLLVGHVDGITKGIYHYHPGHHYLTRVSADDVRKDLVKVALSQSWIEQAPVVIVFTAVYARTQKKYGKRGKRYVHIEVGHAAENLFLQSEALGLATVVVGAFDDDGVTEVMQIPADHVPLLLMPVGRK
ncbi:MAG: SagB/ThcOx family dehydrogenase, partial [Thioalkalispiraceae bacterium]